MYTYIHISMIIAIVIVRIIVIISTKVSGKDHRGKEWQSILAIVITKKTYNICIYIYMRASFICWFSTLQTILTWQSKAPAGLEVSDVRDLKLCWGCDRRRHTRERSEPWLPKIRDDVSSGQLRHGLKIFNHGSKQWFSLHCVWCQHPTFSRWRQVRSHTSSDLENVKRKVCRKRMFGCAKRESARGKAHSRILLAPKNFIK